MLNHLLSDIFNASLDAYEPIKTWINPQDETDFLTVSRRASRRQRGKSTT